MFEPLSWLQFPSWTTLNLLAGLWRAHPRYRGCVLHYLNPPVGSKYVYDISGRNTRGTRTTAATVAQHWVSTPEGPEWLYDWNQNTYIDGGAHAAHASTNMSWSFWASRANGGNTTFRGPVSKTNGGSWTQGWGTYFDDGVTSTTADWYHFVGSWNGNRILSPTFNLAPRTHHVATWNDGAGVLTGYIHGKSFGTFSSTPGTYTSTAGNTANLLTVGRVGSSAYGWNGITADLRIYNRVLSAAEVYSLYLDPYLEFKWAWDVLYERFTFGFEEPVGTGAVIRARALLGLGR